MGTSIGNRVDRFKFYGNNFAKLPPCLPPNIKHDPEPVKEQKKPVKEQKKPVKKQKKPVKGQKKLKEQKKPDEFEAPSNPWTVTVKPSNPIWKDATFSIYGFIHSVHYLQKCTEVPKSCKYYGQFNNSINILW